VNDWNDALDAAKAALPQDAAKLDALKKLPPDCIHPELTFDSGDYYIRCRICNSKWVRCNLSWPESGINRTGQQVGGDPASANIGAAANLSGNKRVEPGK